MERIQIIGYFVDIDGDKTHASDVFVVINEIADDVGNLLAYCPIGQHGSASPDYIKECKKITREEYIKASDGFYTPKEYL